MVLMNQVKYSKEFLCDEKGSLLYKCSVDICSYSMMLSTCSWFRVDCFHSMYPSHTGAEATRLKIKEGTERYWSNKYES